MSWYEWQEKQQRKSDLERAQEASVIILSPNPYGFRYNISHPAIAAEYEKFKHGRAICGILDDNDRLEFEKEMDILYQINQTEREKDED